MTRPETGPAVRLGDFMPNRARACALDARIHADLADSLDHLAHALT